MGHGEHKYLSIDSTTNKAYSYHRKRRRCFGDSSWDGVENGALVAAGRPGTEPQVVATHSSGTL
jgi:hypothetical protein